MPDRKQELLHELDRCVLEMEDEAVVLSLIHISEPTRH